MSINNRKEGKLMKKIKLFFMYHIINVMEKIGDNMYLNIRTKVAENGNNSIGEDTINMYKRYFKFRVIQLRVKKTYFNLSMKLN